MTRTPLAPGARAQVLRRLAPPAAALAAAAGLLAGASAPAHAEQVVVDHFDETHTETYDAPLEGCLPAGLVGSVTLTEHSVGKVVRAGRALVVTGLAKVDFRMTLPDGRTVRSNVDHDRFNVVLTAPHHTVESTDTLDERTVYAADGTPAGTLTIKERRRIVYEDADLDGMPGPGEVTVDHSGFRLTCG
ncbi:hypothetical protein ACIRSU_09770 [Streptomyces sp. NPDC101160]|uniref:hypothetical protein n=1 Tax=Streptomyces sp. NPDC101160 TaxID=3366118 RepID=UPI00380EDF3D